MQYLFNFIRKNGQELDQNNGCTVLMLSTEIVTLEVEANQWISKTCESKVWNLLLNSVGIL